MQESGNKFVLAQCDLIGVELANHWQRKSIQIFKTFVAKLNFENLSKFEMGEVYCCKTIQYCLIVLRNIPWRKSLR